MGIISVIKNYFSAKNKERVEQQEERNKECDKNIQILSDAIFEFEVYFSDKENYIDVITVEAIKNKWNSLYKETAKFNRYNKTKNYGKLKSNIAQFKEKYDCLERDISIHNEAVTDKRIKHAYEMIPAVEGRQLDGQQMECVVKEMQNHLVIAGAGTGKTTTIIAKVKYLLETKKYQPEEILILSFTNASASEMKERISKETKYSIEVSTFHKLGMNILTESNGIKPKITDINLRIFIKEQLKKNMKNKEYLSMVCEYLVYDRFREKSEFDFNSMTDYKEYLRSNAPITLKGEAVKSYGEVEIANYLFSNGIEYCYEKSYEINTTSSTYGQYKPDFYLPEYGIYIEYFGINRKGEVPDYFHGKEGKTASQIYNEGICWKRSIHSENGTKLIECFYYEKAEGKLLELLEEKLKNNKVIFQPIDSKSIFEKLNEKDILEELAEKIQTVINLIKSNDYTIRNVQELVQRSGKMHQIAKNLKLLSIIEPIFFVYHRELERKKEIDFNDMINQAAKLVKEGKYTHSFRLVIVDEYQDISKARYLLLKRLREAHYYNLFCVGDDWQSIYRFTGSDISFILDFKKYWGACVYDKIETTYRFSRSLIEVSGNFIMKNPRQVRKSIKGIEEEHFFALEEIQGYQERNAVNFMLERLDDLPKSSTVFFIGRYKFDKKILEENRNLECRWDNVNNVHRIYYDKRRDLEMQFMSAHKSKGLQADFVFIINNKSQMMGFPSRIQDDSMLQILLENSDSYEFAEERRLFYVALTRAKKKVFLLTVKGKESVFVKELNQRYGKYIEEEQYTCPKCGGHLIKRSSQYGEFFGCSNFSKGCRYKRNIRKHQF